MVSYVGTGDLSNRKDIGETIKHLRIAMSLTQEQFAAEFDVTSSTANRQEKGRGTPSPLGIQRIEEIQKELRKE